MDGNKDESARCIRLAEECIQNSETDQALRYLRKAESLYPSQRAKDLIDGMESQESAFSCFENMDQPLPADFIPGPEESDSFKVNQEPSYTDEQLRTVRKIHTCKDYYEILGVTKNCTEDDLKRSYKKLALKFHPDKNRAPGATEAFAAIGNAFGVLSNPVKRQDYDRVDCSKEFKSAPRRQSRRTPEDDSYDFTHGFEGDISADELFRMFFGAAFQQVNKPQPQFRSNQPRPTKTSTATNHQSKVPRPPPPTVHRPPPSSHSSQSSGFLLQVSPIVFLVALSLVSTMLVGDSAYSLLRDSKYTDERTTQRYGITYYVRSGFNDKYPMDGSEFRSVELQVEDEHVSNLQYNCHRERSHRENVIWRARIYRNDALLKQAKDLPSPACEAMEALRDLARASDLLAN